MVIDTGKLNKRIQIIDKTIDESNVDEAGYPVEVERVVRSCYASVKRTSGSETVKANADFSTERIRFCVRYTPVKISKKMYVRYNEIDYNIVYINDYNDSHELVEIWCELVTNNE